MDDVPAGPASPRPRRPSLSVVVPVRNGGRNFEHCLRRLRDSVHSDFELIVVDDASVDDSAAVARRAGALVIKSASPQGPAAARNLGAKAARAPLIFFLDADVAVHRQTVSLALARFKADPGLSALIGSYDDTPAAPGLVSQYRNLLHHFVHQQGPFDNGIRPAHTYWTGCGMIRRDVFLDFGGFDPRLYPRPAIEDIELGYRLARAGHRIVLARDVLATHFKRWTLAEMVRTDIFRRGVPWMLLIKRTGTIETDLNVKAGQKACVALTGLAILGAALSALFPAAAFLSGFSLLLIMALNREFFEFLTRRKGLRFAASAFALHVLYYCSCGVAVLIALLLWHTRARQEPSARIPRHERVDHGEKPTRRPAIFRWARRRRRPARRSGPSGPA
jgi:glycosyltransferase involved in cell wall biosynthesis